MLRRLLPLLALLAVAGCTTWEKPGATDYDRDRDTNICRSEAYNRFPPRMREVITSPAHWEPEVVDCVTDKKGRKRCTRSGGYWVPDQYGRVDDNDDARDANFSACMYKMGWQEK